MARKEGKIVDFIELKLIEKIANIFAYAMKEKKYNRYHFLKKWCLSDTYQSILDFDETLCSQAKTYILRMFEKEYEGKLPDIDSDSPLYEDDMYWAGYLLTYWFFVDGTSGKSIMKQYDVCKMLDEYDVLHTLSVKAAISKIREDDRNE